MYQVVALVGAENEGGRVITKKDFFAAEKWQFLNGEKRPVNTG